MALKKRALRRSKTVRDAETNEIIAPGRISVLMSRLKSPFKAVFWEDFVEGSGGEQLVDAKLLSYAYLEAGMIEMIGA